MMLTVSISLGLLSGYFLVRHYSVFFAPAQAFISDVIFWIVIIIGTISIFSTTLYFEWVYLWPIITREDGATYWVYLFGSAYIGIGLAFLPCGLYALITGKVYDALQFNVARKDDPFNLKNV